MDTALYRYLRLGLIAAAIGAALAAETPRLGLTAGAAWPSGSTREVYTDGAGFTLGAFADWEQRPGHAIRLALDGSFYPHGEAGLGSSRAQTQALTLNYVFTPRLDMRGLYFVVGAGGMNLQKKDGGSLQETGVHLAWTAGVGLDLNDRWGILARYQAVTSDGRNFGNITTGLTFKF